VLAGSHLMVRILDSDSHLSSASTVCLRRSTAISSGTRSK
jgi:hypothetical protein